MMQLATWASVAVLSVGATAIFAWFCVDFVKIMREKM